MDPISSVRRMPLGEGGGGLGGGGSGGGGSAGGGGGNGGTGAPIGASPVVTSQKLPNAVVSVGAAAPAAPGTDAKPKIQAFNQALGGKKHTESWKRKTNVNGTGATHVKTFHCKLNSESVEYMDQQINQWLDEHPDYEVKFVSSTVGEWTGKIKEPAMVVSVWV